MHPSSAVPPGLRGQFVHLLPALKGGEHIRCASGAEGIPARTGETSHLFEGGGRDSLDLDAEVAGGEWAVARSRRLRSCGWN